MRKTGLLLLAVSIGFTVNAQTLKTTKKANPFCKDLTHAIKADKALAVDECQTPFKAESMLNVPGYNSATKVAGPVTETEIGESIYDLQTNRSTARRVSNNGNGTLSAVWTMSLTSGPNYTDRGTGYNYYDGTQWQAFPTARLEAIRCGFTNIFVDGGNEYILSHTGANGMIMDKRTTGTGTWAFTNPVGTFNLFPNQADVWSRLAVSGSYIHAIVNSQGTGTSPVLGQSGPITYTRSNDGGATWGVDHVVPALIDATQYVGFGAEEYSIDARGNTVAIVLGSWLYDVILLKSTDNGDTWTKTVIKAFPIPLYDQTTMITDIDNDQVADTVETCAGDITVSIDNNGMCHVAYGYALTLDDDPAANASYFPTVTGMYYWNEGLGAGNPVYFDPTIDYNQNGVLDLPEGSISGQPAGLYNTGLTCQPSIGFDAANNIYMSFSNANETCDTSIFNEIHRHVYLISSTDGGATWSYPLDIVPSAAQGGDGEYQEGVYGSMARLVDTDVHIVYQRDPAAGHSLSNNTTQAANNAAENSKIVYAKIPVIALGVHENNSVVAQQISLFPNPVEDIANFSLELKSNSNVSIEVYNIVGKLVSTTNFENVNTGNQTLKVNVNTLSAGTYTYKLKNDLGVATGTFVKK